MIVQPPLHQHDYRATPTAPEGQNSDTDVNTKVRIALSGSILEQAGKAIEPAIPARSVAKIVEVSAPTRLSLKSARSTQAPVAETLSQAVADSYVAYVGETAEAVTSTRAG